MYMFKKITVMILATLVSIGSIAQSSNETESQRQSKALADAVKREFTEIIKSDTEELLKESLENKTITVISYNENDLNVFKLLCLMSHGACTQTSIPEFKISIILEETLSIVRSKKLTLPRKIKDFFIGCFKHASISKKSLCKKSGDTNISPS